MLTPSGGLPSAGPGDRPQLQEAHALQLRRDHLAAAGQAGTLWDKYFYDHVKYFPLLQGYPWRFPGGYGLRLYATWSTLDTGLGTNKCAAGKRNEFTLGFEKVRCEGGDREGCKQLPRLVWTRRVRRWTSSRARCTGSTTGGTSCRRPSPARTAAPCTWSAHR